jgi:hypothetical protein
MKQSIALGIIMTMCCGAMAVEPSESGVLTSPLTIYSGGIGIGTVRSLSDTLKMESKTFFKLSFINDVYLVDQAHLFVDADWLAPRANFGADVGIDYLLMTSRFRPFLGAGVGVRYFDKKGFNFGDNIGPAGTVHAGFIAEISKTVQLRVRVPFHAVLNRTGDYGAGLDVGILFSKPYRHVKKLDY